MMNERYKWLIPRHYASIGGNREALGNIFLSRFLKSLSLYTFVRKGHPVSHKMYTYSSEIPSSGLHSQLGDIGVKTSEDETRI